MARAGKGDRTAVAAGFAGRLVERAIENPAASGGLLVMALTASAIVVNATYLQPSDFPRPHLSPRAPANPAAIPVPTPRPRDAVGALSPATGAIPGLAKAQTVAAAKDAPARPSAEPDPGLVGDTQRELARLGLYSGTIDGILGARTRAAVTAYQKGAGLPATGAVSAELLGVIRLQAAARTVTGSVARPVPPVSVPTATPSSGQMTPAPITAVIDADAAATTYRRVQLALNQIGYGVIPVDGKPGKDTADAIRRFELDYGLPVTGQPNDAVVKRLVAVGALAPR